MLIDQTSGNESDLVQQAQQGNRSAYGELIQRHYDGVVRVVYRMCGEAQTAEDATQEAFIRAWIKLPAYQPRAPFRNWLYRIAVNAALDILRKKPEENLEDEGVMMFADPTPDPETTLIEKEQAAFLQKAVKALPEAARLVLVLREYGELSYQEIASVLEIPIGTVMSRLNYARRCLRQTLQQVQFEAENEHA
ncbi:MAG: RNA polymerase sigma factor [Chloroflexota bacterium]